MPPTDSEPEEAFSCAALVQSYTLLNPLAMQPTMPPMSPEFCPLMFTVSMVTSLVTWQFLTSGGI